MKHLISALFLTVIVSAGAAGVRAEDAVKPAAIASLLNTSGTEVLPESVPVVQGRTFAYSTEEMLAASRTASGVAELISGLRAAQRACLKGNVYDAVCVDTAAKKGVADLPFLFRPAAAPYVKRIKGCTAGSPALYGRACVDKVVNDIIAAVQ